MSNGKKLRGQSAGKELSELTRFKMLWRDTLAESQKDFWRSRFASADKQSAVRAEIQTRLKIHLRYDKQLTQFRKWDEQLQDNAEEAEWAEREEQQLKALGLTGEPLREALLNKIKGRAFIRGDHKLGLQAIDRDLKSQQVTLDKNKFEFDATRAALAKLPELKAISANKELSEDQKLEQARLALFGSAPK